MLFSPGTFAKLLPKLIPSYALDAIEIPGDHSPVPPADSAVSFLRQVAAAEGCEFPTVDLGKTLRLQAPGLTGAGLASGGLLVHLAVFRIEGDGNSGPAHSWTHISHTSRRSWRR